MKVFISYPHSERETARRLAEYLREYEIEVLLPIDYITPRCRFADSIKDMIETADAVICLISEGISGSQARELGYVSAYRREGANTKLVLPVVISEDARVPEEFEDLRYINISSTRTTSDIGNRVLFALSEYSAQTKRKKEKNLAAHNRLQKGINEHIHSILNRLSENEKRQKRLAFFLYLLSAMVLLVTIGVAVRFLIYTDFAEASAGNIAIVGFAYLVIALLIVSFSKFLFTLAKSFMVEAIRCSDRIHAISFGQFYIDAFEEQVTREEIMKIFSTWNIDNGATVFREQSSSDYDPKILEVLNRTRL